MPSWSSQAADTHASDSPPLSMAKGGWGSLRQFHVEPGSVTGRLEPPVRAANDDGPGSASNAAKAINPIEPEIHNAPAPKRSRHRPNNHGAEACAMRAGIISSPCRWP